MKVPYYHSIADCEGFDHELALLSPVFESQSLPGKVVMRLRLVVSTFITLIQYVYTNRSSNDGWSTG